MYINTLNETSNFSFAPHNQRKTESTIYKSTLMACYSNQKGQVAASAVPKFRIKTTRF